MNPTPGTASAVNDYQKIFNSAYYNSKDPVFDGLYYSRPGSRHPEKDQLTTDQIWELSANLIAKGYVVDEEIDAQSNDPYTTMYMRQLYGQTWEPSGHGKVISLEVLISGMYSGPVPSGQIKVSTNINDYPPFPIPAEPIVPIVPITRNPNPVGICIIRYKQPMQVGDIFRCNVANDGYHVEDTWTGVVSGITGTWQKQALLFGTMIVWVKTN